MAFKFRLENVFKLIRLKETFKKNEILLNVKDINKFKKMRDALSSNINLLLNDKIKYCDNRWAPFYEGKIVVDVKELKETENRLKDSESSLEQKKEEFLNIFHQRKALESLKDKRKYDYRLLEERKEQKISDELYQLQLLKRA